MNKPAVKKGDEKTMRIWAPKAKELSIVPRDGSKLAMEKSGEFFELADPRQVDVYSLEVDGDRQFPDPKSLFLPDGVHGPSENCVSEYQWRDGQWRGCSTDHLIIYELHVGTFSESGDFEGCRKQLDYLVELGVNAIELMPLAQCPGRWNWGYDGVGLYAVSCNYGRPDDLRRLIDECHQRELSVIHDVVYNHMGPEGNYLGVFGDYFSKKHSTPWGGSFDFDGPNKEVAREYIIGNAIYWLNEFHFDGLRLDAIHYMFDDGEYQIRQEICDRVRAFEAECGRNIHLIGEANIYDHDLIVDERSERQLYSAIWADDLMHAIYSVAKVGEHLTPRKYRGAADVDEALKHGYLYQGPAMKRVELADRKLIHGDDPTADQTYLQSLIVALQTHDSVGNDAQGKRVHQLAGIDFQKAAAPLILLYPAIPMIFMGEEFAADSPFMFFADFIDQRLRKAVDRGRKSEFPNHDWTNALQPSDERAFYDCKLKFPAKENEMLSWYRRVITLRKQWHAEGWLSPENFTTECRPELGLFSFSYQTADGPAFVISMLGENSERRTCHIALQKDAVILDSRESQESPESEPTTTGGMEIRTNQTLIGIGDFAMLQSEA